MAECAPVADDFWQQFKGQQQWNMVPFTILSIASNTWIGIVCSAGIQRREHWDRMRYSEEVITQLQAVQSHW